MGVDAASRTLADCFEGVMQGPEVPMEEISRLRRDFNNPARVMGIPLSAEQSAQVVSAIEGAISVGGLNGQGVRTSIMEVLRSAEFPQLSGIEDSDRLQSIGRWHQLCIGRGGSRRIEGFLDGVVRHLSISPEGEGGFSISLSSEKMSFDPSGARYPSSHGWIDADGVTHGDFDSIYTFAYPYLEFGE